MQKRFNAKIKADISNFLTAMKKVDAIIKKTAMEVTKPINADIKKAVAKMEEVNEIAKEVTEDAVKDIKVDAKVDKAVAELEKVQAKAKEIEKKTKKTVEVDTGQAVKEIKKVQIESEKLEKDAVKKVKLSVVDYYRTLAAVNAATEKWERDKAEKVIGANLRQFEEKLAELKGMESIVKRKVVKSIDGDTRGLKKKIVQANALLKKIKDKRIKLKLDYKKFKTELAGIRAREIGRDLWINLRARKEKFDKDLDGIANSIRSWASVLGNMLKGVFISAIPSIVSFGAVAVGALSTIVSMAGVASGGLIALANAFGIAGLAVGAFVGTSISNLKDFKKYQKGEIAGTAGMIKLEKSLNTLKSNYKELAKSVQEVNFDTFNNGVVAANKALVKLTPFIQGSSKAMNNLSRSLNSSFDSAPMQRFFDYLNRDGQKITERMGKSVGFFGRSLASIVTAFGPLTDSMSKGFLDMSRRVDEWSAKLANSKGMESFTNYVNENMPKIRASFRDLTVALVNMFAGFGPMASKAMSWFADLMARFRQWSSELGQNQGFKNFVSYIETAAPKVGAFIGNISKTIAELAKGFAPVGLAVLDIANKFLSWFSTVMSGNPAIAELIAKGVVLVGTFMTLLPVLTGIHSFFGKLPVSITGVSKALQTAKLSFGAIATTITVVVGALIYLYNTNETTRQLMQSIWENIKQLFVTFGQIAGQVINSVVTILGTLITALAPVVNAVLWVVNAFVQWLNQTLQNNAWLRTLIATIASGIAVWKILTTVINTVRTGMLLARGAMVAFASGSAIVTGAISLITGALNVLRTVTTLAFGPWGALAAVVVGALVFMYNKVEWFRNLVDGALSAIGDAIKWVGEKVGGVLEWLGLKSEESSNKVATSTENMNTRVSTSTSLAAQSMESSSERINLASQNAALGIDGINPSLDNFSLNANVKTSEAANSIATNTDMAKISATSNMAEMDAIASGHLSSLAANTNTQFGAINTDVSAKTGQLPGIVDGNISQVDVDTASALSNIQSNNTSTWQSVMQEGTSQTSNLANGVIDNFRNMESQISSILNSVVNTINSGFDSIRNAISQSFSSITNNVSQQTNQMNSTFNSCMSNMKNTAQQGMTAIVNTMQQGGQRMVQTTRQTGQQCHSTMQSFYGQFQSLGGYLMDGFVAGMWSRSGSVMATARSIANAAAAAIRSALAIHSPSRVIAKITRWIPAGMVVGMKDKAYKAINSAKNLALSVADSISNNIMPDVGFADISGQVGNMAVKHKSELESNLDSELEMRNQPIELHTYIGGKDFELLVDDISDIQNKKEKIRLKTNRF